MTSTPNKLYPLQVTGTNVGTWGTVLNNSIFSIIDNNLGGTLSISVAGNANINLTASQASFLIHDLTGVLTGNIDYIFPALGGFYAINNGTTGSFSVTAQVVGGSGGIVVPQGTTSTIYIDATIPAVESFTGTQYQFIGGTVGGTANAITVASTLPTDFSLNPGILITVPISSINTGAATMNVEGTGVIPIKKVTPGGLVPLVGGELIPTSLIFQYDGTEWIVLGIPFLPYLQKVSTTQSISLANYAQNYVATGACTFNITQTTNLFPYWYININAFGGNVTISPNASDVINVNGKALSSGASYHIPQGASFQLNTDASGNLYIDYVGNLLNTEQALSSATTTDLGSTGCNILAISGTTTITSFGSSASIGNPFYITRFTGALTLTYNATSLIIPGAANYTTSSGDVFQWKYEGSGNWRCVGYALANGQSITGTGAPLNSPAFTGIPTAPTAANGTNTIQIATTAFVLANSGITKGSVFTMNPYAVTTAGQVAHGLSSIPNMIFAYLECLSSEIGYSAGDRVIVNGAIMGGFGANFTIGFNADATNLNVITDTNTPYVPNKTTGGNGVQITASKWKLIVTPALL